MQRQHPGPDMPNFYSLSPGGVGQITPPLGWWVTDKQKQKKHAQLIHVNDEQILSCLFTSVAQRLCASSVHWMKEWWPPTQGRSAAGCSCCNTAAWSHTTALCAQHMSNTSQHTCPCITIWLLNPHQSLLQALRSLSLTLCLWSTLFVSFTSYLSFFLTAPL